MQFVQQLVNIGHTANMVVVMLCIRLTHAQQQIAALQPRLIGKGTDRLHHRIGNLAAALGFKAGAFAKFQQLAEQVLSGGLHTVLLAGGLVR